VNASRAAVAAKKSGRDLALPSELVFASYLAPNHLPVYRFIAGAVGQRLGLETRLEVETSFDRLVRGDVDVAFLCGLPYVRLAEYLEPLAAPVLRGGRYGGKPIYFSDVIVAAESRHQAFDDLRGASWSFNHPDSHSGYLATLVRLVELNETQEFFGRVVEAGSHQASIDLVARGEVDASAIDSNVLAVELRDHPELGGRLRVIDSFGPAPVQPIVARRSLDPRLRHQVRASLLTLRGDGLRQGLLERLAPVTDAWYEPIRAMVAKVDARALALTPRSEQKTLRR
jgi:phosphonate transport system substrate-binding protein